MVNVLWSLAGMLSSVGLAEQLPHFVERLADKHWLDVDGS